VDLGKLRKLVHALIKAEGEDAPVAAFVISAEDVRQATEVLKAAGRIRSDSTPDVRDVLTELQDNAGDPPFEDQLLDHLEALLIHWDDAED